MPTLDFKGKQFIYAHHLTVPCHEPKIDAEKSHTGENPPSLDDNLIIHGDNLHALKALLPIYAGKIKCIYIDPPYNTGNENWVYNDNVNSPMMQAWLEKNSPIDVEDLERHDKWLCMMWPRLHLLRELLSDDGVIFVSIDDNEVHHLRMLMDEVFGEERFVAQIVWRKRGDPPSNKRLASTTEYLIMYGNEEKINLRQRAEGTGNFANPDNDPRGEWRHEKLFISNKGGRETQSMIYPIVNPADGIEHWPPENNRWAISKEKAEQYVKEGRIVFGKTRPVRKKFKSELRQGITWSNLWTTDNHGKFPMNRNANAEIVEVFGNQSFETPKPVGLIDRILHIATSPKDIVLDSFAGSGTTAHAVLALNKQDGGNRKFILVECEDYADKITAERIRRVIDGVENAKDENLQKGLGGSFTYCTLGNTIDAEGMLTGDSLPTYETLANYVAYAATGSKLEVKAQQKNYCFGETKDIRFYLIYGPTLDFLESNESALDVKRAEQIAKECKAVGKKAYVYASHKFMSQKELTPMGITFCQLPYSIYQIAEN